MIEPELAFADLNDDMACASAYLQFVVCCIPLILQSCHRFLIIFAKIFLYYFLILKLVCFMFLKIKYILDNCKEDMEFFDTWISKGIIARLSV